MGRSPIDYITVAVPKPKIPIYIRVGSELKLPDLNSLYEESLNICRQKPDLDRLQEQILREK